MEYTLQDNIKKQINLLKAINHLSKEGTYYLGGMTRGARKYNNDRRRDLRHCLKKIERLTVVIRKQAKEIKY